MRQKADLGFCHVDFFKTSAAGLVRYHHLPRTFKELRARSWTPAVAKYRRA